MARKVSRRAFVAGAAAMGAGVACSGIVGRPGLEAPPTSAEEGPEDYLAVAPRALRAGQMEAVTVSLFKAGRPATGRVTAALVDKEGKVAVEAAAWVRGHGLIPLQVPRLPEGDYQLRLKGAAFQEAAPVRVESGTLVFVETDKPIYKPGQLAHLRVLTLDPTLKPAEAEAVVEVTDAKGIKVFKKTVQADEFGMATVDLPLSNEPNLGVWKVKATSGKRSSQVDVRVERYVLPKYEVKVEPARAWALAGEPVTGTVAAEYSFGKPVAGEVEIVASRYAGTWQEYARMTRPLDGKATFEVPPVRFAAGTPGAGGNAQVRLDVTVREQATGYEEKTSRLLPVAAAPVNLRLVPEAVTFKPGLPFSVLVVSETPDKKPVDAEVQLRLAYTVEGRPEARQETLRVATRNGLGTVRLTPPAAAVAVTIGASAANAAGAPLSLRASYSPSGSFIQVEQEGRGSLKVGETARFTIHATAEATSFYYEVLSRGKVVFSDVSRSAEIALPVTPLMVPEARLLVYQVLPNAEVAADYLPFKVEGSYPQAVEVRPGKEEVKPGEAVEVRVQTRGPARVGLAVVDRSVFMLAENRLNLQQVFDELERLYQEPRAEAHERGPVGPFDPVALAGAKETFQSAGVVVLSNRRIPEGKKLPPQPVLRAAGGPVFALPAPQAAPGALAAPAAEQAAGARDAGLAEVERVRQYFPETWVWADLTTDEHGTVTQKLTAPDSITTWMFRAVALSKENGLGVGEAPLKVFQPFFVQLDLPYAAVRGEEFPARVALYNYTGSSQEFTVALEAAEGFEAPDDRARQVTVGPNSVGTAAFTLRPISLGVRTIKVSARSGGAADALVKEVIVEPEGVARERVENVVLAPDAPRALDLSVPEGVVPGSARALVAVSGSMLSQSIDGLEGLLRMSFGCGEQNMVLFAPNVFVARYLKETGQTKPEVQAKAEKLMLTGYQRELTYRRSDASFSAFGDQDKIGSLWLTAFVLKTFAQARDLIHIDENVLATGRDWLAKQQKPDGSFAPVGFVHHQELMGGVSGTPALTAYLAIALKEAGADGAAARAVKYLEDRLAATEDAYALAIIAYALALHGSGRAGEARSKLMALAREADEGLSWAGQVAGERGAATALRAARPSTPPTVAVETTAYATLALLAGGDPLNAGRAARWLASQRNAQGGFGSTQDTVVGLQALTALAASAREAVDATVTLAAGGWQKEVRVRPDNADVVQVFEAPAGETLTVAARGKGAVIVQAVRRFNVPVAEAASDSAFRITVDYGADQLAVDDLIPITATVRYTPPAPVAAGMVVLDLAVPTGFAAEADSLAVLARRTPRLKRWDLAGRKVILYLEDMAPDEQVTLTFQARALFPARAQAVASQAYAYYRPEWKGESLGGALVVNSRR